MKLGNKIKQARKQANLSQAALGKVCGWGDEAQSRISNYESGRRVPTIADLQTMADALSVDLMELISGVDDSPTARVLNKMRRLDPDRIVKIESIVDEFLAIQGGGK